MSDQKEYLMEDPEEAYRLELKTNPSDIRKHAEWFGIGPGARVLDVGCGSGKTASILSEIVQPGGEVVGIDFSEDRIRYAAEKYRENKNLSFRTMDITREIDSLGEFDFVWVRFLLEYFQKEARDIIQNLITCLREDGSVCLMDLDNNCLSHYPLSEEMEKILKRLVNTMSGHYNFDPYVGRKLYTYLYELGFRDIQIDLTAHHLIYGDLRSQDQYNWIKKLEMISRKAKDVFSDYPDGFKGFFDDFRKFFSDPKRFTYTPLILCKGKKPS